MIAHVLRGRWKGRAAIKSFNNQIGVPLTVLSTEPGDEFLVVEIGTNAPGEIDMLAQLVEPEIAVVTGVAPAHLEKLGTLDGIATEKLSLFTHVREGGCAIVNIDSEAVRARLQLITRRTAAGTPLANGLPRDVNLIRIGYHETADLRLTNVVAAGDPAEPCIEFDINGKFHYALGIPARTTPATPSRPSPSHAASA